MPTTPRPTSTARGANALAAAAFALVGAIHLVPAAGVLGAEALRSLYGTALEDPALVLLMRHRAVLLGGVGLLCLGAALHAPWRPVAFAIAGIAVLAFLVLAAGPVTLAPELVVVRDADRVALAALVVAGLAEARRRRHHARTG